MDRREFQAVALSPGVGKGILRFILIEGMYRRMESGDNGGNHEIERLETSVGEVVVELETLGSVLESNDMRGEADILRTHALILKDPEFQKKVCNEIRVRGVSAETALEHALSDFSEKMRKAADSLLSERIVDFRDIVLRLRMKMSENALSFFAGFGAEEPGYVAALEELLPSVVLEAKKWGIRAFIAGKGTHLSHAAILAKSFGIPAVKIDRFEQLHAWAGTEILVDAGKRRVVMKPTASEVPASKTIFSLPKRQDLPLRVWLNIADPELLTGEWESTVEGIGLYRTEILFMRSETDFPTEEAQLEAYRKLFFKCSGFPVTIRTLDIGGDKTLSYFSLGPQENPYMGLRAHRIYRFHPELFISQMKAILRAKPPESELRILYPMVGDVEELLWVWKLTMKALHAVGENGKDYERCFRQGILLEVPCAVWHLESLLERVDFASVGTNDLLQFFHACDRNNANVTAHSRPEDPGFLRMLKYIVDTANKMDKPLGICGEMAADVDLLPVLVGLGFDNISVDLQSLPAVTRALVTLDVSSCASLANACMSARTAYEAREIIRRFNGSSIREKAVRQKNMTDVDPVCGMHVFTGANSLSAVQGERRYHFCSKMCMERFLSRKVRKVALR